MSTAAIILAAGKGTRMSSQDTPKVLHEIAGRPLVAYVIDAVRTLCGRNIFVVVGYQAERVIEACRDEGVRFVRQEQQRGTGHAVMQCRDALQGFRGSVVVLNGDVPCLRPATIRRLCDYHAAEGAAATVLTAVVDDPTGYGRIVRSGSGDLLRIVEERDADDPTKGVREINSGLFCFDKEKLFAALPQTNADNEQDEYYLTDVVAVLEAQGEPVRAYRTDDAWEVSGVNTDEQLDLVRNHIRDLS